MKKTIQLALLLAIVVMAACGSKKAKTEDGFTILDNGLQMKFSEDKDGPKADSGSISKINIVVKVGDSTVFDSKKMNNNQPVQQPIAPTRSIADLMAGFMEMSEGDKAIFRAPADSMFPNAAQRPPFVKDGDMMTWDVEMVELQSIKDIEAEGKERLASQAKDIEKYMKDNNVNATKTASGMYIAVTKEGTGPKPTAGQIAKMKYTGYLLDGSVFDSNVDPKFKHATPFEFPLGQGRVIKGWDEGIAALSKGAKAKLIIPSDLAYGAQATPPRDESPKGIPAHSPLVFDVEVLDYKDAPAPQPQANVNPDGTPK